MNITLKRLNKLRTALHRVALRVSYQDGVFSSLGEPLAIRLVEPLKLPVVKVGDEPEVRADVLAWFIEKDEVIEWAEVKNGDYSDVRVDNLTPAYYVLPTPPTKKTKPVPGVCWNAGIQRWAVSRGARTISNHYTQDQAVAALIAAGGEDTRKKRKRKKAEPITPDEVVRLGVVIPRGISFDKIKQRWVARKNGEWLGRFLDPRDAIEALGGCSPPAPAPRPAGVSPEISFDELSGKWRVKYRGAHLGDFDDLTDAEARLELAKPRPQPTLPPHELVFRPNDGGYWELFVRGERRGIFGVRSEARAALLAEVPA
jgi:hypothetical protein